MLVRQLRKHSHDVLRLLVCRLNEVVFEEFKLLIQHRTDLFVVVALKFDNAVKSVGLRHQ